MSIFKLAGPCSAFTNPVKPGEIVTAAHSLGIYAGVNGSRISSAPLEEMLKMEGLAAARTVPVCLPGQKRGSGGSAVPQRDKPAQEEMWDSKAPWHGGTWGAGSHTPAAHGAAMWARPRHSTAMAHPWHGHGTAWK